MTGGPVFAFGAYQFSPQRQLLLKEGLAVRVGCRALDLLGAFVRRPGEVLSKRELLDEAWPCTTVVEGNLKVHIAALRRALEDDAAAARYIATVNGRGYRFVAPVETGEAPRAPADLAQRVAVGHLGEDLQGLVALLARTNHPDVVAVRGEGDADERVLPPRRILFIALTARDEAWLEYVLNQAHSAMSATH